MLAYTINMTPDSNGTILVTCPDLPEVTTFGEDEADALMRAVRAIEEALAARIADREDIPTPSPVLVRRVAPLPALTTLKVALYQSMRESGASKAELARRLSAHGLQVDRLLNLRHASRLEQIEAALHALGKSIEILVR